MVRDPAVGSGLDDGCADARSLSVEEGGVVRGEFLERRGPAFGAGKEGGLRVVDSVESVAGGG